MKLIKSLLPEAFKDRYRWTWWRILHHLRPPALPKNSDGGTYIHLGCGQVNHPKFINVDAMPWPHVHHVGGVERLPMFKDASVDLVYVCHCLEHIGFRIVPSVLQEWRRVLKPGGWLRISVPDFDHIVSLYLESGRDVDAIERPLLGGQGYPLNFHKSLYNRTHLSKLLIQAGFVDPREWQPGSDDLKTFNDWSGRPMQFRGKDFPISLNLEAQKPFA